MSIFIKIYMLSMVISAAGLSISYKQLKEQILKEDSPSWIDDLVLFSLVFCPVINTFMAGAHIIDVIIILYDIFIFNFCNNKNKDKDED